MTDEATVLRLPKRKRGRRIRREESAEVVFANIPSSIAPSPDRILNAALDHGLETAMVIGWDKDGDFFFGSSASDGGDVLWLLASAKRVVLDY